MADTPAPLDRPDVLVVGSANADLVLRVPVLPRPGETVLASGRSDAAGGKGLNQAVAAARSGARTAFLAAVGTDAAGDGLLAVLGAAGVDASLVRRVDEPTGLAVVSVDDAGENSIVVAAGANARLAELAPADAAALAGARVVLAQLEVPVEVVAAAVRAAREGGVRVLLNAAPARPLPDALLADVDVLVVNEHEALLLAGGRDGDREAGLEGAVAALLQRVPEVVVTLGSRGAVHHVRGGGRTPVPALAVRQVDSTGAGDTFAGALAAELARGAQAVDALRFATAAAGVSVGRAGAVPSIPTRGETLAALNSSGTT